MEDSVTIRHMARARPECNGSNTRCSSAADRIIVRFSHEPSIELSRVLPLFSSPSALVPFFHSTFLHQLSLCLRSFVYFSIDFTCVR